MGSAVRCGSDSYAEIVLPGGHIVKLDEDTTTVIDKALPEGASSLTLDTGKMRLLVASLGVGETLEVTAMDTVMGVRGTDFVVSLTRGRQVELMVLDGRVGIRPADESDSAATAVDTGMSAVAKEGRIGTPEPIAPDRIAEVRARMRIRTTPEDMTVAGRKDIIAVTAPRVMEAAAVWARLDDDTQWDVQHAVEDYVQDHPEILQAVDEFFRVNGMEEQRGAIESLFE
jgi:hypothetical protein